MAAAASETSPLLPTQEPGSPQTTSPVHTSKPTRTVTFSPQTSIGSATASTNSSIRTPQQVQSSAPNTGNSGQPILSALNNKLRRRNSQGTPQPVSLSTAAKIGPQRTTKNTQKLKLLPNPDPGEDGPDEESGRDVYSQFTRIKDPTARRDAARLGKADRDRLPRVTAYCTANAYRLDGLMRFLKGKVRSKGAAPKLFDECIYSPFSYGRGPKSSAGGAIAAAQMTERRYSDSAVEVEDGNKHRREDLISMREDENDISTNAAHNSYEGHQNTPDFDTEVHTPEVFLFNYGAVVIWGMSISQEQRFLKEIAKFETEKLGDDDVQTENFNFYYTREYQARIYNDFISLREKKNYMTKLAISHALAQSVKVSFSRWSFQSTQANCHQQTSLFEDLVDNTIEVTKDLPERIALTGKVNLTRKQINMQIGELFILRINIHLQGSVLDSPELMWAEPQLEPVYQAVRSYLEMDQRVGLLTERLNVIADLLAVLKDQLSHTHDEFLEWIVIILIAAEILVAAVNIVVDLYAGVE